MTLPTRALHRLLPLSVCLLGGLAFTACDPDNNPAPDTAAAATGKAEAATGKAEAATGKAEAATGKAEAATGKAEAATGGPKEKLNLNTATKEQFMTVPDVGARMAHEFDEYRPYVSIQQFRKEMAKYVEAPQIAAYEKFVFVPIDPNKSDAETLKQIEGIGDPEAAAIIAARPFATPAAFTDKLNAVAGEASSASATKLVASDG